MLSRMKAVSTGIGIAGTAPLIYSGYWLYSRDNPTGIQVLEKEGYTFNKPELTNYESVGKGCSENLFKSKENLKDNKVYGCMTARMEKSNDNKGIKFNSEVAIRKGDKGGTIHTRVRQVEASANKIELKVEYLFSEWTKEATANHLNPINTGFFGDFSLESDIPQIYIKVPENETPGYSSNSYLHNQSPNQIDETLKFDETKEYAGVWISDDKGPQDGIFDKLEIWSKSRDESEFFGSKDNTKWARGEGYGIYGAETPTKNNSELTNWGDSYNRVKKTGNDKDYQTADIQTNIKSLMEAVKDNKGKGIKMDDVCNYAYYRHIGEREKQHLKMFCFNKPN